MAFREDWFSQNIPFFEAFAGGLKGAPCRIVEIGTHEGRSTVWFAQNLATHVDARIDTVDTKPQPTTAENLAPYPSITQHLGHSFKVLRTLPLREYDLAYIDGSHWTIPVLEDAVHCFRLVKKGGLIAFDDYHWDDPRFNQEGTPKPAIDAFLALYQRKIEVLHISHMVWVRKIAN